MSRPRSQIAIVGAGPYGLAAATHLRSAGVEATIFGEPMGFWQSHMPAGMLLRSTWSASHIADPHGALTLDAFDAEGDLQLPGPLPVGRFIDYGHWYRCKAGLDVDVRQVAQIAPVAHGFQLILEDGEPVEAERVVVATGLTAYAHRPAQFATLPPGLASHSSDHHDLGRFAGQQVLVVGGGQSALEMAALLNEAGAGVELVARAPRIRWLRPRSYGRHRSAMERLLFPPTDVGPPGLNRIVDAPELFRRLPRVLQRRVARRAIPPAGAAWLRPRLQGMRLTTEREVVTATPVDGRLRLKLSDGSERCVDHLLLATGYRTDISSFPFLAPELRRRVQTRDGSPELAPGFGSSVPGLHFIGAAAAESFGPLMRFVAGTGYTARALARRVAAGPPVGARLTRSSHGPGGP